MAEAGKTKGLVDLAMTKAEQKAEAREMRATPSPQPYAWGLSFRLEEAEMSKLGITELPGVGDEYHMLIVAKVTNVASNAYEGGKSDRCVGLTITMAQVVAHETAAEEAKEKESPATEDAENRTYGVLGA